MARTIFDRTRNRILLIAAPLLVAGIGSIYMHLIARAQQHDCANPHVAIDEADAAVRALLFYPLSAKFDPAARVMGANASDIVVNGGVDYRDSVWHARHSVFTVHLRCSPANDRDPMTLFSVTSAALEP